MAQNSSYALTEWSILTKSDLDTNHVQALFTQYKEMRQQIATLTKQLSQVQLTALVNSSLPSSSNFDFTLTCDFCQGNHRNGECAFEVANFEGEDEQVYFVGGNQRNNPYSNIYNPEYHLSWGSPALQPPPEKQLAPWEAAIEKLAQITNSLAQNTNSFMDETRANFKNLGASVRNLEVQVGQIAKQLSERPLGSFPSDTIPNPKEQCKDITLQSGKSLEEPHKKSNKVVIEATDEQIEDVVNEEIHSTMLADDTGNPDLDKYVGLHACVDMTKLTPSNYLPSFYLKQLLMEIGSTHEIRHPRHHKGFMHVDTMGDAIMIQFDPGGNKNGFILMLQEPCLKPWDPGINSSVAFVSWDTCFKIWDPD